MRFTLSFVLVLLLPSVAFAHLELLEPTPRDGRRRLKDGPCGVIDSERGPTVATFAAGDTITVRWDEYVDHPSHYRVSLDPDGDDGFVDPPTMMDFYSNDLVLLDAIADREDGGIYEVEVTLPDIACERCVLQVIQVMYDKPPYEVGGNDNYYQCADIEITAAPMVDAGTDSGVDTDAGTVDAGAADAGEDVGVGADGGTSDSGTGSTDSGAEDSGGSSSADAETDTGSGAVDDGGCSVSAGHSSRTSASRTRAFIVLAGLFAFVRRRSLRA